VCRLECRLCCVALQPVPGYRQHRRRCHAVIAVNSMMNCNLKTDIFRWVALSCLHLSSAVLTVWVGPVVNVGLSDTAVPYSKYAILVE